MFTVAVCVALLILLYKCVFGTALPFRSVGFTLVMLYKCEVSARQTKVDGLYCLSMIVCFSEHLRCVYGYDYEYECVCAGGRGLSMSVSVWNP